MMVRRAEDARRNAGVLAVCLRALWRGDSGIDGDVGALILAETVLGLRGK